jgi:predicted nucleic acid-binding protein
MMDLHFEPAVLDTDVTSFLFNRDPVRAPRYRALLRGRTRYLSFVTVGELWFGAELRRWGPAHRARLAQFLQHYIVIQSAPDIVENWAGLRADAQQRGYLIERQDAWVAAVALTLDLPLVTHNAAHFETIPGLHVITSADR